MPPDGLAVAMPRVELQISAQPINVRTARLLAAALGRRIGLDAVVIDEVKLAVGEACSRAVSVHRAADVTEPIIVQFQDDPEFLEVSVWDCGPAGTLLPVSGDGVLDLAGHEDALAEEAADVLAPRLGLAMIAGLVDDMSVEDRPRSAGTVVIMRWPVVAG
jgi:anti-sigma regulatory factor (Ser/Thr protein kinase)